MVCKNNLLPFLLVRFFLPAALLIAIALRPFGLSVIYLLLFLISPLIQVPDAKTLNGVRGKFLLIVIVMSVLLLLTHIAWHSLLAAFPPYGSLVDKNELVRKIGYNLGLVSFLHTPPSMISEYVAPEVLMFALSAIVYIMCRKFAQRAKPGDIRPKDSQYRQYPLLVSAGKYLALLLIMFSGILWPSITSGIYFLTFVGAATMWALDRLGEKALAVVGRCIMAIMAVHSLVLMAYQSTWAIELLPPDVNYARIFGLIQIVSLNETSVSYAYTHHDLHGRHLTMLASPVIILVTYYVLGIETRELFKPKPKKKATSGVEGGKLNGSLSRGKSFQHLGRGSKDRWIRAANKGKMQQVVFPYIDTKKLRGNASETTPLIRSVSTTKRWSRSMSATRPTARQDSSGSVVVGDAESESVEVQENTILGDIIAAITEFFQVMIRSSYIATTITMMAWSILYHSWLTFVFLMWANVVWLCQNQRQFMLKTSPILVLYATALLFVGYVYGMDLTEDELPSSLTVTELNIRQIGLGRDKNGPFVPMLLKSLFTCMFWLTLRQRVQDVRSKKQAAALVHMAAPLQLTVSTAASVIEARKEEQSKSRILTAIGNFLRAACARFWIYVVAIMLFVIGITGERMTIFRIIYMFLFLVFILMFQISWYWWRRLMYVFWIVVIIYSMTNLILLYVYQFDNFSIVIETYLFINEKLQHDLGLEPYPPADLFVKLLTPTLFLIITIMQVHYFHKDFMALSDYKSRANTYKDAESSRRSQGASTIKDDIPPLPEDERDARSDISDYDAAANRESYGAATPSSVPFRTWLKDTCVVIRSVLLKVIDRILHYLDIHFINMIYVALMLLCVFDVCALHVPIMLTVCLALPLKRTRQRGSILFISLLISIYLMARMVYQIDYIKHSFFDVNCTTDEGPIIYNNVEWLGFEKATSEKSLVSILKGYISLIAMLTFHSLISYKHAIDREIKGLPEKSNKLLFPEIRREHADIDLVHCVKYLFNYGFYKFGVEICLMCMIGVIGSRMDVYAVIYALWLLTLVSVSRKTQAKMWKPFTAYVTIVVPVQYLIAVGFLPQFCIHYPWSGGAQQMKHIRNWLFLPYALAPPHAIKLIFDYFLLLFTTLQLRVFRLERIHGNSYPGGSNEEETGLDWETPTFVNPVPDFLGLPGTWLDIFKRMIFLGMLWVTLAIMFMTGTNRVNLFSIGYLIGSFIFLWQGTDLYLLPKDSILHWWSWLLRYNVVVVFIKTLLQIPGCIFSADMQHNACWLVQLLGIGCVDKFAGGSITKFLRMEYVKDTPCSVPQEDIGLAWDGVCFAFLILQRRFFHSYYFYRIIDDSKATAVLASRGAELIEELRIRQMQQQEEQEMNILAKIKVKMEKIKANQRKLQGTLAKDPIHHDAEEDSDTHNEESEQIPLVRGDSDASGRGFHTPDSPASPRGFHTPVSKKSAPPSPAHTPPPPQPAPPREPAPLPVLPPPSSHGGPPSPSSALMTASLSLDAYLEPRRISFESPPSSDLLPRAQSPEESYPVFSPPPIRRRHTVASPSLLQRTSMISQSSRSEPKSHHDSRACPPYRPPASHQKAIRSGDYYMFDDFDDDTDESVTDLKKMDEDVDAPKQMGLPQLLKAVIMKGMKTALVMRRASFPSAAASQRSASIGGHSALERRRSHKESTAASGLEQAPSQSAKTRKGSLPPQDPGPGRRGDHGESSATPLEEFAPTPQADTWFDKIRRVFDALVAFISCFLVSVTRQLMKQSRDYRYVSRTLTLEKNLLKDKVGFGIGLRHGSQMRWEPLPEPIDVNEEEIVDNNLLMPPVEMGRKLSDISVPEIRILAPSMEGGLDASPAPSRRSLPTPTPTDEDDTSEHESAFTLQTTESKELSLFEGQEGSTFNADRTVIVQLLFALWYAILAHTDIVCFIMVFINQIQSATILSIPLPLMVFLWGTLTIPRPTKTFWVTLIAYTEVIVLIKSMFQFEILPWNQKVIPANMPFTAPRIIGIERKKNYALYDLLLLLIIFLHRFMLKSLGLWKESTPDIDLREDMDFQLEPQDTQMLVEGRGRDVGKKYIYEQNKIGPRQTPDVEQSAVLNADPTEPSPPPATLEDGAAPDKNPDEHFKVNDDQEPIIAITTTLDDPLSHYPGVIWLSIKRYMRPTMLFFRRMTSRGARVTADVYAYMFLCDFFNFLVVIFGFAAFGTHQGDGGVQTYLEENKVPIPFLVMLILQFALIVIDRALYLRKFMFGKILFQYALIIGVHIWMFFILPYITERTFNTLPPPPMWYMVKCIYLLLSAYQIRCGYPRRIIGNFLCKSYRFLNMIAFRAFMVVPFVFELRTLMDWIWTDTSMTLMDWLKMEDIFANVFLLKCSRSVEDEFPAARGQKKSSVAKYMLGGTVLAFVIAIIWFPLVFFAFGNTVGQPNPPTDVTVKIRIGPFLPVYQMSAQSHNIALFSEQDYTQLSNMYARDRTAQTFISNYMYNDIAVVTLNPNSTMKWTISPPELSRLEEEAESNATLAVKFTFVITHPSNTAQNPPTIEDSREVLLEAYVNGSRNPERLTLSDMLTNKADAKTWLKVKTLFPKFLKVFNKGTAKPASQLTPDMPDDPEPYSYDRTLYRDVQMRLERDGGSLYWRVREACTSKDMLSAIPLNNCDMLIMYTFNDKLFPETLNFISGGGIIGLYTTFVFLASRIIRGFFSGIYTKIMFDDLPNVNRVLQLCLDIYLVREALELALEEDLFAKLVFLYRSPETMIKWSRVKEEEEEERPALPPSR